MNCAVPGLLQPGMSASIAGYIGEQKDDLHHVNCRQEYTDGKVHEGKWENKKHG